MGTNQTCPKSGESVLSDVERNDVIELLQVLFLVVSKVSGIFARVGDVVNAADSVQVVL